MVQVVFKVYQAEEIFDKIFVFNDIVGVKFWCQCYENFCSFVVEALGKWTSLRSSEIFRASL